MKPNITVKELRHRAEMPMIVLCIVLTILAWIAVFVSVFVLESPLEDWAVPILIGALSPFLAVIVIFRHHYWKEITNGVEITEKQFPEIYQVYVGLAKEMGFGNGKGVMAEIPRLYLKNGDGTLNAFASKCQLHKGYVVLYSDLMDIAYKENDFEGIAFILAHELGHIKCGHVSAWRTILQPVAKMLFLEKSLTRAQEWTADRCGYYYAPEGKRSMMVLSAGKNLYSKVDFDEFIRSVDNHKDGFWLKYSNFMADHAVGFRRIQAIKETEEKGWDVHGKML
ncbi:M48 family metallopeptidase [Streptococcus sp. 121]|uniref:M48 family metallopeptidase n=1 Tax=Streptococcus sp. 121 TaxID=2797637 RepID=UPI001F3FD75A|nr:M48 family metallopeptidase [Streptococcus sp. 121]